MRRSFFKYFFLKKKTIEKMMEKSCLNNLKICCFILYFKINSFTTILLTDIVKVMEKM